MNALNIGSLKQYGYEAKNLRLAEKTWYCMGRSLVDTMKYILFQMDVAYLAPLVTGAKLLCANHPTTVDPVMMTTLVPEQVSILISETLFKVPGLGRSLAASGHIRVEHNRGRAALETGIQRLEAGRTVGIFPEGAISQANGSMARAHTGAARMALTTNVPVIPIGIAVNSKNILRIKTMVDGVEETGTWYLRGPYAITVGEAMFFDGDSTRANDRETVHQVTDQIAARIAALSQESARRLEAARQPEYLSHPVRIQS